MQKCFPITIRTENNPCKYHPNFLLLGATQELSTNMKVVSSAEANNNVTIAV